MLCVREMEVSWRSLKEILGWTVLSLIRVTGGHTLAKAMKTVYFQFVEFTVRMLQRKNCDEWPVHTLSYILYEYSCGRSRSSHLLFHSFLLHWVIRNLSKPYRPEYHNLECIGTNKENNFFNWSSIAIEFSYISVVCHWKPSCAYTTSSLPLKFSSVLHLLFCSFFVLVSLPSSVC